MRPLTYAETIEGKPFERNIKGVGKLTIPLWSAMVTMKVFEQKQIVDRLWDNVDKGIDPTMNALASFKLISQIIFSYCKKPKFNLLFKRKFFKWADENVGQLLTIWEDLIKANTAIFFLMKHLRNCEIVPSEKFTRIGLQTTPKDTTRKPKHGSLSDIYGRLRKPKSSENTTQ